MNPVDLLRTALSDRYTILREIGAGGMATVYLAADLRHARPVALKVLRPELGAVLGVDRFLSEIRVTANLQHPHLLPLFDSGEAGGVLFYVMPYAAMAAHGAGPSIPSIGCAMRAPMGGMLSSLRVPKGVSP
jgi:eukaryotic-like serine/threonine-protein kinase